MNVLVSAFIVVMVSVALTELVDALVWSVRRAVAWWRKR